MKQKQWSWLMAALTAVMLFSCKQNTKSYTDSIGKQGDLQLMVKDDTLTAFMLGGIYIFQGYGGADKSFNLIRREMKKKPGDDGFVGELDIVYRKIMEYPFHRSEKEKIDSRKVLQQWWDVHNEHEFHQLLEQLQTKGHQDIYLQCRKILDENGGANADVNNINYAQYKLNPDAAVLLQVIKDNYKSFSKAGIKAWDIARYVNAVCLGYSAEYIEMNDGYTYLMNILADTRKTYSNWTNYYRDFMLGRRFWGGDTTNNAVYQQTINEMQEGDYSIFRYMPLK